MSHVTFRDEDLDVSPADGDVLLVAFPPRDLDVLRSHLEPTGWNGRWAADATAARGAITERLPRLVVWKAPPTDAGVTQLSQDLRVRFPDLDIPVVTFGSRAAASEGGTPEGDLTWDELTRLTDFLAQLREEGDAGTDPAPERLLEALSLEIGRVQVSPFRSTTPTAAVVLLDVHEREHGSRIAGPVGEALIRQTLGERAAKDGSSLESVHVTDSGQLALILRRRNEHWVRHRVQQLSAAVLAAPPLELGGERVRLTPVIGWSMLTSPDAAGLALARTQDAWERAGRNLDLVPVQADPRARPRRPGPVRTRWRDRHRHALTTAFCIAVTLLVGAVLPFAALVGAEAAGIDASRYLTWLIIGSLLVTSASIWAEGIASRRRPRPPRPVSDLAPRATAVVAAYLPNEAATILETVDAFLASDYPDLEVVLAYNTPERLPVEEQLRRRSRADPRLVLLPVAGSTSKAQNVNAAIGVATGAFVGIFDADHHPAPDAFDRARGWLENGFDVVQGRCVVRNGRSGFVARTVAVEFEAIYGASHPGRTRLHGFGIFGGSNGYWRASTLAETRLQGSMLTEDIDSSIRLVLAGGRIGTDPGILSYELAPTSVTQLWRQRVRWAQGWFQVSRKWGGAIRDNPELTRRQKLGLQFLIRWRELNPWLTQLLLPLIVFQALQGETVAPWNQHGTALLASLVILSTAPGQVWFAWRNATPASRRHPLWFVMYFFVAAFGYTEWKNLLSRVSHVREVLRLHEWVVTPRS